MINSTHSVLVLGSMQWVDIWECSQETVGHKKGEVVGFEEAENIHLFHGTFSVHMQLTAKSSCLKTEQ